MIWEPEKRGERRRQSAGSRRRRSGEGWPLGPQGWESAVLIGLPGASGFSAPQRPVLGSCGLVVPKGPSPGTGVGQLSGVGWALLPFPAQAQSLQSVLEAGWSLRGISL